MTADVSTTRWPNDAPPSRDDVEAILRREDLSPSWWSNGPGDTYASHSHTYHKVLICAQGSIDFVVQPHSDRVTLSPGDRLDIPAGVVHSAVVGAEGVTCAQAARTNER